MLGGWEILKRTVPLSQSLLGLNLVFNLVFNLNFLFSTLDFGFLGFGMNFPRAILSIAL